MTQVAPPPPRRSRRERDDREQRAQPDDERRVAEAPDVDHGLRGRHATTRGQGFDRLVGWTILGSVVPGVGLIVAGRRTAGRVLLGLVGLAVLVGAFLVLRSRGGAVGFAAGIATDPTKLLMLAVSCAVLGLLWAVLVVVTHTSLRRYANLTGGQRWASLALVAALIGVGLIPAVEGSNYALITRDTVQSVFKDGGNRLNAGAQRPASGADDPWASIPRVNVLLIGSDAGANRDGVRPDTLIVASIDTKTGDTVLFSLPRNLQRVPFPAGSRAATQYPDGFYCFNAAENANTECLLNAIWKWAEDNKDRFYPGVKDPGLRATVDAVEGVLGLPIDEYAMVNLRGFQDFVDAIGGVELDVKQRLPIGGSSQPGRRVATGGWIEPGENQRLNGYRALWFARSRWSTSDYDRMQRQRCVIAAVTQQADPVKVAQGFPKIARAAKDNLETSIALDDLDAWVTLTLRVKNGSVRSLAFTDKVIKTVRPDFDRIRTLVAKALQPPAPRKPAPRATDSQATGGGSGTATATPRTGTSTPKASTPRASSNPEAAEDVTQVC